MKSSSFHNISVICRQRKRFCQIIALSKVEKTVFTFGERKRNLVEMHRKLQATLLLPFFRGNTPLCKADEPRGANRQAQNS